MQYRVLAEKLKEAAASVLPVTAIVAVLCLALVRVDVGLMLSFLLGSGLLIVGMGLSRWARSSRCRASAT